MPYDFSDLGGVPVSPAKSGYDFSDLGGQRIGGNAPAMQSAAPAQPQSFMDMFKSIVPNLAAGAANTGQSIANLFFPNNPATNIDFDEYFGVKNRQGLGEYAHEAPRAALQAATFAPGLIGGAKAVGAGVDALRPTSLFRGKLSPEELQNNLRVAEGTETPLGNIIDSPSIKKLYENFAGRHLLSGSDQKSAGLQNIIKEKGQDILNNYLGDTSPGQVYPKIVDALEKASKEQQEIKSGLYKESNAIADKIGLDLKLPSFSEKVKDYMDLINDQSFLKTEPKTKKLLQRLTNYKEGLEDGKPTLNESNILAGKLNQLANRYRESPLGEDKNLSQIFGELGGALKSDIKNSIKESGSEDLKNAFSTAEKNYAENYVPFLDKDIYKYTHGGKDPQEILSTFIKTGKNTDKSNQLSKLMSKLDPEAQNLLKYAYLSRSLRGGLNERSVDPNAFKELLGANNLGPEQAKALFSSQSERQALDDYAKLSSMNTESLSRMLNNANGQRAIEAILNLGTSGTGATIGASIGGPVGAALGGLAGFGGSGLLSRYLTNKLTNPAFRKQFVEKMIQRGQQ